MSALLPLNPQQLYHPCDPGQMDFDSTIELEDMQEIIGQMRAMEAIRFATGIHHEGYNVCVLGPPGTGKRTMVLQLLEKKAATEPVPVDWCYVNNFDHPHQPRAISLPSGKGVALGLYMDKLVEYLGSAIPALFESDEYHARAALIRDEFAHRQDALFNKLATDAAEQDIALLRTPEGFSFAPTRNHAVIPPDEYEKLPIEEKQRVESLIAGFQVQLEKIMWQMLQWRRERHEKIDALNHETALPVVVHLMNELKLSYNDFPEVLNYLERIQSDLAEHIDEFRNQEESTNIGGMTIVTRHSFTRYKVNILITDGKSGCAPVISEDNPTYSNLVGRIEHISQFGALVTDFTLIKPGALHRANGGYLLLDINKVLVQPFAWEALKRALHTREIRIESLGQMYSLVSTVSLEPEPIPLNAKVILFGDRLFYYLLQQYDPEFGELFKVAADCEERIVRDADTQQLYARLIATLVRRDALLPFDRSAVARVIEHAARLSGDAQRLTTHMRSLADLLCESDYWTKEAARSVVNVIDVQQAIDTQIRRQDRIKQSLHEAILRDILMIDTHGLIVGQINGLSVIELGDFAFAIPSRITATSRLGEGELVNIEREVKLSGAIHSKGVLILSSFLAARYAKNQPLSLSASLVFEQSYGTVDGDSASLAELCALLSNLANIPLSQALAVTGSVNQLGQVQAIGAVNEKIEGFFDICTARKLTGEQGVLIPAANIVHLMLRQDVVQACEVGTFRIYAVQSVDQAMEILTGMSAGEPDAKEGYPPDSINQAVAARLTELTNIRLSFADKSADSKKTANRIQVIDH